jgi:hypothetical protein
MITIGQFAILAPDEPGPHDLLPTPPEAVLGAVKEGR